MFKSLHRIGRKLDFAHDRALRNGPVVKKAPNGQSFILPNMRKFTGWWFSCIDCKGFDYCRMYDFCWSKCKIINDLDLAAYLHGNDINSRKLPIAKLSELDKKTQEMRAHNKIKANDTTLFTDSLPVSCPNGRTYLDEGTLRPRKAGSVACETKCENNIRVIRNTHGLFVLCKETTNVRITSTGHRVYGSL